MAPKRRAPAASEKPVAKKANKSNSNGVRSVQELFSKFPAAKGKQASTSTQALLKDKTPKSEEPWTSKYAPKSRAELAVHNKKVQVGLPLACCGHPDLLATNVDAVALAGRG